MEGWHWRSERPGQSLEGVPLECGRERRSGGAEGRKATEGETLESGNPTVNSELGVREEHSVPSAPVGTVAVTAPV